MPSLLVQVGKLVEVPRFLWHSSNGLLKIMFYCSSARVCDHMERIRTIGVFQENIFHCFDCNKTTTGIIIINDVRANINYGDRKWTSSTYEDWITICKENHPKKLPVYLCLSRSLFGQEKLVVDLLDALRQHSIFWGQILPLWYPNYPEISGGLTLMNLNDICSQKLVSRFNKPQYLC